MKKQWRESKTFRVAEKQSKQSSDDFSYLTSIFPCSQADT